MKITPTISLTLIKQQSNTISFEHIIAWFLEQI